MKVTEESTEVWHKNLGSRIYQSRKVLLLYAAFSFIPKRLRIRKIELGFACTFEKWMFLEFTSLMARRFFLIIEVDFCEIFIRWFFFQIMMEGFHFQYVWSGKRQLLQCYNVDKKVQVNQRPTVNSHFSPFESLHSGLKIKTRSVL